MLYIGCGRRRKDIPQQSAGAPKIILWYGTELSFGLPGNPQNWLNILGNVSSPEITSLTYSLNGASPVALALGPSLVPASTELCPTLKLTLRERIDRLWSDCGSKSFLLCLARHAFKRITRVTSPQPGSYPRRLYESGDFNIEIYRLALRDGHNSVVIRAIDKLNRVSTAAVTLNYTKGKIWPLPYYVDWTRVHDVTGSIQILDGRWTKVANGIRPLVMGYDRLFAIGDITWKDYEVTVTFTVHAIDLTGSDNSVSIGPALGLITHWQGHSFIPIPQCECSQPRCGWSPSGASAWYAFRDHTLRIEDIQNAQTIVRSVELNTPYIWKMRSETISGQREPYYRMKLWKAGRPEPEKWDLQGSGRSDGLTSGSIVLDAHHVDVTFGNISVTPVHITAAEKTGYLR
jgi:hypothetical protein